jgi:hypothetical protein
MQRFFDVVQDRRGNAIVGATVTVKDATGANATIYSDNGVTSMVNPLQTNPDGEYTFFASNGRYTVQIVADGYGSDIITDVVLNDPDDRGNVISVTASRALTAADAGQWLEVTSASAVTLTVPSTLPLGVRYSVIVCQAGAGQVTLAAGSGTTLATASSLTTRTQGSVVALSAVGAGAYQVYGDLT